MTSAVFARAAAGLAAATPPGLVKADRFRVYRNNVAAALAGALAVRYPAVKRLVGDEFFAAMAREYTRDTLPRSPVLIGYGAEFPDFIAGFAPASGLPYLADVARLESAWWRAYHAGEAEPLAPEAFAIADLDRVRFAFHPSVAIVRSRFAIASIVAAQRRDGNLAGIDLADAEAALVYRRGLAVIVETLSPSHAGFLDALMAGVPLGAAAETAGELETAFTHLVSTGIVTAIHTS
jgi:Putative DNA-binding domain